MGSVISSASLDRLVAAVSASTNRVLIGGVRMTGIGLDGFDFSKGNFFAPTIIEDVSVNDALWKEELFGPVVVVARFKVWRPLLVPRGDTDIFKDEKHGVSLANACKYGLGSGIWTRDLSLAHRVAAQMEAGLVWVNTHHRNDPSSPWCVYLHLRALLLTIV